MGWFKRFVGFVGFGNHEVNKDSEDDTHHHHHHHHQHQLNSTDEEMHHYIDPNLPRKGFSVSVQVPVDKAHQIGPILVPCPNGDAAVQGLEWYTRSLKIDEDGDVADEFLEEVFFESVDQDTRSAFQVNLNTKSAKARKPCLSPEGTVQHYVKHHGRSQLI
ncbi:hypothetical protein QVD17_28387 [Tagetes erecta]|uniref:Uncharacterized protein n=1 Tax=Tagetes erecta TaxID=13708 RepID=A0AAD8NS29_TARER|nr:hypothetical protein QVD17_28387 [Tagetes erecta]